MKAVKDKTVHPVDEAVAALDKSEIARARQAEMSRPAMDIIGAVDAIGARFVGDIVPMGLVRLLAPVGKARTVQDFITAHVFCYIFSWYRFRYVVKDGQRLAVKKFSAERLIMRRSTLANQLGCHKESISKAIRSLEAVGLICSTVINRSLAVAPIPAALEVLVSSLEAQSVRNNGTSSSVHQLSNGTLSSVHQLSNGTLSSVHQLPGDSPSAARVSVHQLPGDSPSAVGVSVHQLSLPNPITKTLLPQPSAQPPCGGGGASSVSPSATGGQRPPGPPACPDTEKEERYTPGKMPEAEEEYSPANEARDFAQRIPWVIKVMARQKKYKRVSDEAEAEAREWFRLHKGTYAQTLLVISALGILKGEQEPVPLEGNDPAFYCRRFAHKPDRFFGTNKQGDLILAHLRLEVQGELDNLSAEEEDRLFKHIEDQVLAAQARAKAVASI